MIIGKQPSKPNALVAILLLTLMLVGISSVWAKGMKGALEKDELDFVYNTFVPILIRSHICVRADGDCLHDYLICASHDSLSCNVYGIADDKVIKEILIAVIHSGLNVSSFTFWRSKYHQTSLREKPLLQYIDRTWSK
jgi:hypothetical protein